MVLDLLLVVLDLPLVVLDLPDFGFFLHFRFFLANFLSVLDLPGLLAPSAVDRHLRVSVQFVVVLALPSWFLI